MREALRRICRELARLVGADTAAAYLHDFGTGQLVPAAAYHVPKEYLATLSSSPLPLKDQGFFLLCGPIAVRVLGRRRAGRPVHPHDVPSFPHQSGLLPR